MRCVLKGAPAPLCGCRSWMVCPTSTRSLNPSPGSCSPTLRASSARACPAGIQVCCTSLRSLASARSSWSECSWGGDRWGMGSGGNEEGEDGGCMGKVGAGQGGVLGIMGEVSIASREERGDGRCWDNVDKCSAVIRAITFWRSYQLILPAVLARQLATATTATWPAPAAQAPRMPALVRTAAVLPRSSDSVLCPAPSSCPPVCLRGPDCAQSRATAACHGSAATASTPCSTSSSKTAASCCAAEAVASCAGTTPCRRASSPAGP